MPRPKEIAFCKSSSFSSCFILPKMRSKHLTCNNCNHKFYVPVSDSSKPIVSGGLVPLLLPCGHPICSGCVKENFIRCFSCNKNLQNIEKLPVNVFTLGLLISSTHGTVENEDQDFGFCQAVTPRPYQVKHKVQGHCYECGCFASVKCVQCMVLFCIPCYSKIHGRALQNHTQSSLDNNEYGSSYMITNNCSRTCLEVVRYFCNDCDVSSCSNCMLQKHKMHNYVTLREKNEDLLDELKNVNQKIADNLQRIIQTKQKLKSPSMSSEYHEPVERESVEMMITKHFAHLHGILQNAEEKLINQLYLRQNSLQTNLSEIRSQLRTQEEQLNLALSMSSHTIKNFDRVDVQNAVKILSEMADVPCHLVCPDSTPDEVISFTADEKIIEHIESHCTLTVPQALYYKLVRTESLPEDYVLEPLKKSSSFESLFSQVFSLKTAESTSDVTTLSTGASQIDKLGEVFEDKDSNRYEVEVSHIIHPSLFFVRYLSTKAEFLQLEKDLQRYVETCDEKPSIELEQDDMCVVKDSEANHWYRGRVVSTSGTVSSFDTTYTIFYVDYGHNDYSVPASRIRIISEELLKLSPQAIRCSLHGIVPYSKKNWTDMSTNDFRMILQETSIFMHIIKSDKDILYVDIYTIASKDKSMGPQSMCTAMLFMKHACKDPLIAEMHISNTPYVYNIEELLLHKKIAVTVNHVVSPIEIYVTKKGQNIRILKLLQELKKYCEDNTPPPLLINALKEGLPCIAQYIDGCWHRCQVVKVIPEEDSVQVFYKDIGCTSTLSFNDLRGIPHKFTQFKAQAIRLSLMYVSPEPDDTWKPESTNMLLNIFNRDPSATVIPRKFANDAYQCSIILSGISDLSRLLKSKGVVNHWNSNKLVASVQQNIDTVESSDSPLQDSSLEECDFGIKLVEEETVKDPFKMEVRIKRVITPDCIYVSQADYEESNTNLTEAMQQFYNNYCSESRDNWSENALCTVYSAKDKAYFRARILEITSPTEVLVYLCDMGIDETVTMKDIQVLHPKFTKQPAFCFKVKLAGIYPCGGTSTWPTLSCSMLSDTIRKNGRCKFFITKLVQQEICDNVIPVELWVRQIKIPGPLAPSQVEINSVNRMLVDNGVALPIKDYLSKVDSVRVSDFKQQLQKSHQFVSCDNEENVQWLNKEACRVVNCGIRDSLTSCENSLVIHGFGFDMLDRKRDIPKESPPTDWLPPVEIMEEVFHAVPTYVDNYGGVYLHTLKQNTTSLKEIEKELQSYTSTKIKAEEWKEGDICIAKYHLNNKWYRGRVTLVCGNSLKVHFVDYGNTEEIEASCVTKDIKTQNIPIQCTKCIISGLSPDTDHGKWELFDLDRIHVLLVERKVKVCILQRQPTHLVVSITLLDYQCNLLTKLASYKNSIDMKVKIEAKQWNKAESYEDMRFTVGLDSTKSSIKSSSNIDEITGRETADTSKNSSLDLQNVSCEENMISGNLLDSTKSEYNGKGKIDDFDISLPDILDDHVISSTPQNESEDESCFGNYKPLNIPPDTKYIELILCCNKNSTISYAQLAKNNDDVFSDVLHDYHSQYEAMISDMQEKALTQPLIESFENNISCVAKFTDGLWYRCVIKRVQNGLNPQVVRFMLHYVDYGNNEIKDLNMSESYDLRVPKKEWLEVPAMAIECHFWNIDFVSDDVDLLASKLNEIYNDAVVARVKEIRGNVVVAEMYKDKTCQELLYKHLMDEGIYQYKKPEEE